MKKMISILGTITLIGISTTSLIACDTAQYIENELKEQKEKNNLNINGNILEWIAPQEKPFNQIDNKYYFVIWRGESNNKWNINKFYNSYGGSYYAIDENSQIHLLFENNKYFLGIKEFYNDKNKNKITISKNNVWNIIKEFELYDIENNYIKLVYSWNGKSEPNTPIIIDKNTGEIKIT